MKMLVYLRFMILAMVVLFLCMGCPRKKSVAPEPEKPGKKTEVEKQDILPEGRPYTVPDLDMRMVWAPPGKFLMGSPESEPGHQRQEEDLHHVIISRGFWIGQFEVTQAQFEAVMGYNPSIIKGAELPVNGVTWAEAQEFCDKLNNYTVFLIFFTGG